MAVNDPVKHNAYHARQDFGDLVGSLNYLFIFLARAFAQFIVLIHIYIGVMNFPLHPAVCSSYGSLPLGSLDWQMNDFREPVAPGLRNSIQSEKGS